MKGEFFKNVENANVHFENIKTHDKFMHSCLSFWQNVWVNYLKKVKCTSSMTFFFDANREYIKPYFHTIFTFFKVKNVMTFGILTIIHFFSYCMEIYIQSNLY